MIFALLYWFPAALLGAALGVTVWFFFHRFLAWPQFHPKFARGLSALVLGACVVNGARQDTFFSAVLWMLFLGMPAFLGVLAMGETLHRFHRVREDRKRFALALSSFFLLGFLYLVAYGGTHA